MYILFTKLFNYYITGDLFFMVWTSDFWNGETALENTGSVLELTLYLRVWFDFGGPTLFILVELYKGIYLLALDDVFLGCILVNSIFFVPSTNEALTF
jgi:hypothetical protein